VIAWTLGSHEGAPRLHVLDSTDPAQVDATERRLDLTKTLFIVSSKSGSTLEPNIFKDYFFGRVSELLGATEAARRFIAITDPRSQVEAMATAAGFRHIGHVVPSVGGRYSALSDFGMLPAAVTGVDVGELLRRAQRMVDACGPDVPAAENPAVVLGVLLGESARHGRDKLAIVASPAFAALGAWLEQLIAESTGKQGHGLIPVDREPLGRPECYGEDRVFAYLRASLAPDPDQDALVAALELAGHPVARIELEDPYAIGGEFFRWELATAVAGAVIGINPFDQPDVEASKVATRELTSEFERTGSLPAEASHTLDADVLRSHLARIEPGDYFAVLAYVEMTAGHEAELMRIRAAVRDATGAATCGGFGPRFLHSTGQAYKGGPNSGVFLQITCDDAADLEIPGHSFTFGVVKLAQARGDLEVLAARGRRALRVHLGEDVSSGLAQLREAIEAALAAGRKD
jgi:transaldolase / glucose-6-phosphate isomerase